MHLPVALTEKTYEEAADEFGFSRETIERLYTLWGLAAPPRDALIRADDEAILRVGASVFDALGRDEALLAAATRSSGRPRWSWCGGCTPVTSRPMWCRRWSW